MKSDPVLIPAGNPGPMTGSGNNTWLLIGEAPSPPTLIDAGTGVASHLDAIETALNGRSLARALVTHGHADHASGAPALRARWPRLETWKLLPEDENESGWLGLTDGQTISAGDRTLAVIHTPGHALDHVCFWDPDARDLFAGDMLTLGTTVMIPAGRGGGLRAYMNSLERLAALAPVRVFPGHGPIINNPVELISQYLAHRRMRETQVRECLAAGIDAPVQIVEKIYPDLAPGLRAAACATIEAHLEKIRIDDV